MIKIYITDVSDLSIDTEILKTLPDIRVDKINKLQNNKEKVLSYGASLLINKYVLNGDKSAYFVDSNGKPYSTTGLEFNLSHSDNMIILAVSENKIGCDIQKFSERNFERMAKFVFHKNEVDLLSFANNKADTFFKLWTKKEAFLKLIGTGFTRNATNIDLSKDKYTENSKEYYFFHWKADDYYISICTENSNVQIKNYIVNL